MCIRLITFMVCFMWQESELSEEESEEEMEGENPTRQQQVRSHDMLVV